MTRISELDVAERAIQQQRAIRSGNGKASAPAAALVDARLSLDAARLEYMTLREAVENPELTAPPAARIESFAYVGRTTLFSSREKMGKSTLTGQAIATFTRRGDFLQRPTHAESGVVLWYAIDEPLADAVRRLQFFGADIDKVILCDGRPTASELCEAIAEHNPDIVVIDTLSELWAGKLENDRDANAMTVFLRPYIDVARDTGIALILLYHTNKAGREYRGSVALGATVDAPLTLRLPASCNADDTPSDDDDEAVMREPRRVIAGRTRWGQVFQRLSFDGSHYTLGEAPPPLRTRILWALRDGLADSGTSLASSLKVQKAAVLTEVRQLQAGGYIRPDGRKLALSAAGEIAATGSGTPQVPNITGTGRRAALHTPPNQERERENYAGTVAEPVWN